MADLVAIGYPDEKTASRAARAAERRSGEFGLATDAIATIARDKEGGYHVTTSHHPGGAGVTWGMIWGLLFGLLFFVPVFGMAVGSGLGALLGKVERFGIDKQFQNQVRDMLQPGTSALFLIVEEVSPDKVVEALRGYGGTVLTSSLSQQAEVELQKELHGSASV